MAPRGSSQLGSSSEPAFTTRMTLPGGSLNKGEPHSAQKPRAISRPESLLETNRLGSPLVTVKAEAGTTTAVVWLPPEAYWQSRQWQSITAMGSAETS
jgi:hypothetical protein